MYIIYIYIWEGAECRGSRAESIRDRVAMLSLSYVNSRAPLPSPSSECSHPSDTESYRARIYPKLRYIEYSIYASRAIHASVKFTREDVVSRLEYFIMNSETLDEHRSRGITRSWRQKRESQTRTTKGWKSRSVD